MTEEVPVSGTVLGYPRWDAVVGAEVTLNGKVAHTNHEGRFTIYTAPGRHIVGVASSGWEPQQLTIETSLGMSVDFLLRPQRSQRA